MRKSIVVLILAIFFISAGGGTDTSAASTGKEYLGPWVAVNAQNYLVGIVEIAPADTGFFVKELSLAGKVKSETPGKLESNGSLQAGAFNYMYIQAGPKLTRSDGLNYRKSSSEELESIKQAFKKPTPDVNY